jgi:hypothetical protein
MDNGGNIFKRLFQLLRIIKRAPPQTGDDLYDSEEDTTRDAPRKAGIIKDIQERKAPIPKDLDELLAAAKLAKSGGLNVSPAEVPLPIPYAFMLISA